MWAACLKFVAQTILLHLEVETGLEVEPEAVRRAEVACKAVPGRGDPSLAVQNLVDPPRRHADGYRKTVLGHGQRLQELLQEPDVQVAGGASGRCV